MTSLLALLLSTAPPAPGLCAPVTIETVRPSGIAVRQVPTPNARIIGRLTRGTIVHVCGQTGGWSEVRIGDCLNRGGGAVPTAELAACPTGWIRSARTVATEE